MAQAQLSGNEKRFDKVTQRFYFVDHNNQTTSWEDPRLVTKQDVVEVEVEEEQEEVPVIYDSSNFGPGASDFAVQENGDDEATEEALRFSSSLRLLFYETPPLLLLLWSAHLLFFS